MYRLTHQITAAVCAAMVMVSGCGQRSPETAVPAASLLTAGSTSQQEVDALAERGGALTVWTAYWDCEDDVYTIRQKHDKLAAVSLFAAYFQDGAVVVPDAARRTLEKLRRGERTRDLKVYLSVVNDAVKNGKTEQKDTQLLHDLLDDEGSARDHAAQLVALASELGCDGVEIDYEKIRGDLELWDAFLRFETMLLAQAGAAGLSVRIVLEPSTPVEQLTLPDGADYVVMCYNLHGGGTDPGPKADQDFLAQLWNKFSAVPRLSFALANGGYDWENGTTTPSALTGDAAALLAAQAETVTRDETGALTFSYRKDGKDHTVWYADGETLAAWAACLDRLSGGTAEISLWRL